MSFGRAVALQDHPRQTSIVRKNTNDKLSLESAADEAGRNLLVIKIHQFVHTHYGELQKEVERATEEFGSEFDGGTVNQMIQSIYLSLIHI